MRTTLPVAGSLLIAVCLAGCAALFQAGDRESPEQIAERGLLSLERGDYASAIADLEWVSTYFPDRPAGRTALLALAAAELDPSNPDRRPTVGAELLARYRTLEESPAWAVAVATAMRGLVLELRDTEARAEAAERAAARSQRLARQATERAREAESAEAQRVSLSNRVSELEQELARSRRQLAAMRDEVDRMRRTLGN